MTAAKVMTALGRLVVRLVQGSRGSLQATAGMRLAAQLDGRDAHMQASLQPCFRHNSVSPRKMHTCTAATQVLRSGPLPLCCCAPSLQVLELDPVSTDEAIDEMENVGHDFFVYRDLETDQIQVRAQPH